MSELILQIHRDFRLRGGLTPFIVYANGEPIGILKNGKTLAVSLPRQDAYILDTQFFFTALAVLNPPKGCDQISLRASLDPDGSLQFLTQEGSALPRCTVSPYAEKPNERREEQTLRLCMEWYISLQDGFEEALMEQQLPEVLAAMEEIDAYNSAQAVRKALDSLLPGCTLPLPDDDDTAKRLAASGAKKLFYDCFPPIQAPTDLMRAAAGYILKHQLYA